MSVEDKYLKEDALSEIDAESIKGIRYREAESCFTCKFSTGAGYGMRCLNSMVLKGARMLKIYGDKPIVLIDKDHVCSFYKKEV